MFNILIVDDSLTMRKLIRRTIESLDYSDLNFQEAKDGEEALNIIEREPSAIDCIFLDINMPIMSGFELLHQLELKKLKDNLNIIICSTEVLTLGEDYIDELNVLGVIPKPFKRDEIYSDLTSLLDMAQNSKKEREKFKFDFSILIVDDSISMRKIIKKQLRDIGCSNIKEAKNGKEALERIAEDMEIQVVFIDLDMPVMSGLDLLIHLEKSNLLESIKAILLADDDLKIKESIKDSKGVAGIVKPFKESDLRDIVIPILERVGKEEIESENSYEFDSTCDIESIDEFKESEVININDDSLDSDSLDSDEKNLEPTEDEEEEEGIKLSLSIDECIEKSLEPFEKVIENNLKYFEKEGGLDFLRMKRFIFTAFKHLIELDPTISSNKMSNVRSSLLKMEKIYSELEKRVTQPIKISYENVFLARQREYSLSKRRVEDMKRMIGVCTSRAKALQNELKDKKEKLSKVKDRNSESFKAESSEYKRRNREYVDLVHKASVLKDEIKELNRLIVEFEEEHFNSFQIAYSNRSSFTKSKLLKILNTQCLEFDELLWEKAKESNSIRHFFESSEIQGSFSSVTFLEYFLKSINRAKANAENQKLFELLDYLKKRDSKTIFILSEEVSDITKIREIIEGSSKSYRVQGFTSLNKLLNAKDVKEIDLLIFDYDMNGLDFENVKKSLKNKKSLLLFRKSSKNGVLEAMERGFLNAKLKNYLVKPKYLNSKELIKKVNAIV